MISRVLFEGILNVSICLEVLSNIIKISGYAVTRPSFEAATSWMQDYSFVATAVCMLYLQTFNFANIHQNVSTSIIVSIDF